jgi:hypothetical protein
MVSIHHPHNVLLRRIDGNPEKERFGSVVRMKYLTGTRFSFVSGQRMYFRMESAPTDNSKRAILQREFSKPHLIDYYLAYIYQLSTTCLYIEKRSDYD